MSFALIIGPPGCGKTTELCNRVQLELADGNRPLICSLTRTAAREVLSRGLPIPRESLGTLHSHAFHALGRPKMAEAHLADFNATCPQYRLSGASDNEGSHYSTERTIGDELLEEYNLLRARVVAQAAWPLGVQGFAAAWETWKAQLGVMDFADLIDGARRLGRPAPGNPDVILVDEAQDHSRAELELLRVWARHAQRLILIGDPWQALYVWRGAAPSMFSANGHQPAQRTVLDQSYRVPRAVHAAACGWIEQLSTYTPIVYHPRDEEGMTCCLPANYRATDDVLDVVEKKVEAGLSVMICASARQFLSATLRGLRERAIPFANPWRMKAGDWNPLRVSRGHGLSERIRALITKCSTETEENFTRMGEATFNFGYNAPIQNRVTLRDVCLWAGVMESQGTLRLGVKKRLAQAIKDGEGEGPPDVIFDRRLVERWFTPGVAPFVHKILDGEVPIAETLRWWSTRLISRIRNQVHTSYLLEVARRRGVEAFTAEPRVYPGTIHSFKGAEADVVIVYPDLSWPAQREWVGAPEERDAIIRLFYVALTRARQEVYVCMPVRRPAANVWEYVS